MSKETGGPAFPSFRSIAHNSDWETEPGLTLRDYFAIHSDIPWSSAMEVLRQLGNHSPNALQIAKCRAELRYTEADAMLAERSKE